MLICSMISDLIYKVNVHSPSKTPKTSSWLSWLFVAFVLAIPLLIAGFLAGVHRMLPGPQPTNAATRKQVESLPTGHGPVHQNIMTTVFWVGEPADSENDHISNVPSAWDGEWEQNFGGFDDPDHRSGYDPAKFTPRENPFYFALPYNDMDEIGKRRSNGHNCLQYTPNTDDTHSWCKNTWIAVVYGGKTAYAQWQDVGPNEEYDPDYVFGTVAPKNTFGAKAGLDVSPAVRDYLGLDGDNHTSWSFIPAANVPDGPWKKTVTTSLGYQITE